MGLFSFTLGRTTGGLLLAFVAGIAAHSFFSFHRLSLFFWTAALFIPIILFICLFALQAEKRKITPVLLLPLLVFSFVLGAWRFETALRPKLRLIDGRYSMMRADDTNTFFGQSRKKITERIAARLPPDEAALVSGILYGEADLSKQKRELFRSAGLTHIIAVSGSNVTIIVQVLSVVILRLGFSRRRTFWIMTAILGLFTAFVGFGASTARAAFMGWLMLLARETGRLTRPFRLLLLAAAILLFINPWQLGFDAGFALSFSAMWGLMAWAPLFEEWFKKLPGRFEIRRSFAMTASAMLLTAPYLAFAFHRVPLAGIIINVLALPLVPFIMGWGAVLAVWGNAPGAELVSAIASGLVRTVEWMASLSKYFSWMEFRVERMELSTLIGIYLFLFYFCSKLRAKNGLSTFFMDKH